MVEFLLRILSEVAEKSNQMNYSFGKILKLGIIVYSHLDASVLKLDGDSPVIQGVPHVVKFELQLLINLHQRSFIRN